MNDLLASPTPFVRRLAAALALSASAGSLAGLAYVEVGRAEEGEARREGAAGDPAPCARVDAGSPKRSSSRSADDRSSKRASEVVTPATDLAARRVEAGPPAVTAPPVTVPDFEGERLSSARRKARELGLRL